MSSWLDKLLEELQRRQEEADARSEGRPLTPREKPARERNVTPIDGRRRTSPTNGGPGPTNGGTGGTGGGPIHPPSGDALPWRRYAFIGGALIALFVIFGLLGGIVGFVTDLMWFDALGRREVFATRFWAQVALFVIGFFAMLVPILISTWLARRIAPQAPVRQLGSVELPDVSRLIAVAVTVIGVLLSLGSGAAWAGSWETVLLFLNAREWGIQDPTLGRDIGFYVFDLPFLHFLQGWAFTTLIIVALLTIGTYAARALRWQFRLSAPVRAHISVLGALVLVVIAAGYQLDIADLAYSTRGINGSVQAATYTDMNAQLPASVILTFVALAAAAILVLNTWFRTLWLLGAAAGSWFLLSILVGGVYPGFVQRVQVEPNELAVERPYLRNHLDATRAAFGLDTVEERRFTGEQELTREVFAQDEATVTNLRLWDYRPLLATFGQQQILRQYYTFGDVDIDRYDIGGEQRQIMLSARELDIDRLADQARTWTNERLVFTHGYGLTAVPVDAVTPQGQPDYIVSGINQEPQLPVTQPRIYFGEETDTWVVSGTDTQEFDYPLEEGDEGVFTTWAGRTGVDLGNPIARALFAMRFGDLNLLISGQLTGDSQILFHRQIEERVKQIAPFLAFDRDPYLVSADDKLVWMWDAYTLTDRYPNAQPLSEGRFAGANYIRNSVKVVIDAYDGTVDFYIADEEDPIIAAYAGIFPELFEPISAMPEELVEHLRYPEDLFTAQNQTSLVYHLPATDAGAATFYNQEDRWAIPDDTSTDAADQAMEPYYVTMRIPGEEEAEFVLIQPLVAESRPNMIAWSAARMDPGFYGERILFRYPSDTTTLGPVQVEARIGADDTISEQFTLWSNAGSSVVRGNLLVLPIGDDGLIYIEPIFLQARGAPFPEFVRVILVDQERVAFARTVEEGLRQLLGEVEPPAPEPVDPTDPGGEPGGPLPEDVAGLVTEVGRLYDEAQAALDDGDLGTYQQRIEELGAALDALAELTAGSPAPSPSP